YGDAALSGLRPCEIAARGIVRTFQRTSVFPQLTVFDNVLTGPHLRRTATLAGILGGSRRGRGGETRLAQDADALLAFVGLAEGPPAAVQASPEVIGAYLGSARADA